MRNRVTDWLIFVLLAEGVIFLTMLIVITLARMIFER